MRIHCFFAGLAFALALTTASGAPGPASSKKLIEFGWDEPDPAFMRQHLQALERSPFDGCVFHLDAVKPGGGRAGSFTWEAWGTRAFRYEELNKAIADLQATPFRKFTNNFLRFNTAPAKLDWFDDYRAVIHNAELAARVAKEGRCPGLLFDIEQYEGQLFDFRKQRDNKTKSWDEYAAQVRQRGREVMAAFQTAYPNLTVFLTFGYSLPWAECGGKKDQLAQAHYGLLAPFLDGMVEAARGAVKLVDGHELSYNFKTPAEFRTAYQTMEQKLLPLVAAPEKYRQVFSFSFGLWMDQNWRKLGWSTNEFAKNYHTPEQFETCTRAALAAADEYVWIYTEVPRWWSEEGTPVKMPPQYDAAVRQARAK
jgi:hypothetical protein